MDSKDLERLFTAFATGSSRRPGSGIGMLVSQEIVAAHGGKLMVDTRPEVGTTIVVLLPPGTAGRGRMITPRALVVDDEPQMLAIVTFALESKGFTCVTAATAAEAWHKLTAYEFHLAVLDIMLPHGSGLDLTERIRAQIGDLPIILLTARADVEDRIKGLEAGADDYLTKPFSPQELALRAQALAAQLSGGRCSADPRRAGR
ncbi:response regulator [Trueperella pyogenes]|uniref:ATP-binding response regulator n=1 Tax=Trueperella pyogenes TaxID=1661 RepID=UPI00324CE989